MENEKRLIVANAIEARMGSLCDEFGADHLFIDAIVYEIENAPTVDAVEVVHGRWEWMTEDMYNCTYCGDINHVKEVMGRPAFNYCPNCGAKMDGDGNG